MEPGGGRREGEERREGGGAARKGSAKPRRMAAWFMSKVREATKGAVGIMP